MKYFIDKYRFFCHLLCVLNSCSLFHFISDSFFFPSVSLCISLAPFTLFLQSLFLQKLQSLSLIYLSLLLSNFSFLCSSHRYIFFSLSLSSRFIFFSVHFLSRLSRQYFFPSHTIYFTFPFPFSLSPYSDVVFFPIVPLNSI